MRKDGAGEDRIRFGRYWPARLVREIALAFTLLAVTAGCYAGSVEAASSETLQIESTSPYGLRDLIEEPNAQSRVTLTAELVFPDGISETARVPVMVYVHGSGGPLGRHQKWLRLFREMGIATVQADHFAPRGVTSTVGNQSSISGAMMTADAFAILNALAKHPRIDPSRIGIMGSSKGGGVATYVAWNPARKAAAGDNAFAVHVALYPTCVHWEKNDFTGKPMLVMIGDQDNYTGVVQCVESVNAMRDAGYAAASVKLYPDAYHAFDDDRGIRDLNDGYDVRKCKFVIKADGETIEATSGLSVDNKSDRQAAFRRCVSRGVTLGGNQVMPEAMKDVRELVGSALLR